MKLATKVALGFGAVGLVVKLAATAVSAPHPDNCIDGLRVRLRTCPTAEVDCKNVTARFDSMANCEAMVKTSMWYQAHGPEKSDRRVFMKCER